MTTPNSYFPRYNGTNNADDPLVTPWWIPGWTAQNITAKTEVASQSSAFGPGFPTNLAFVQVTGNYFDTNSSPLAGYVTLLMSSGITVTDTVNSVSHTYRLPQRYTGTSNFSSPSAFNNWGNQALYLRLGGLNIEVFATDQTASGSTVVTDDGNPMFYYVTEHWLDGRQYQIQVPSSSAPGPIDINSLIVTGTVQPYQYDPVFPMGSDVFPVSPFIQPSSPTRPTGFVFTQSSAATTWNITTNLGFDPGGITVIDGSGTIWMPSSISYPSVNQVILTFATAVAGTAYLS